MNSKTYKEIARSMFSIGDTIRNVSPYRGEPGYKLVGEDQYGFLGVWTGSKYGPGEKKDSSRALLFYWDMVGDGYDGPFKKVSLFGRLKLFLIGQTWGQLHSFRWIWDRLA